MPSTPGAIARRRPITGPDHPQFQISKDEWNDPLVVESDAPDGAMLVRDRTQPDGWAFTDVLPSFLGVPPWRTINGYPLYTDVVLTKADLGLGNVENVPLSTWAGSAFLVTLGTVTTGTWQGDIIQGQFGGTGSPFVEFTGPSAPRTYTLPDTDATLLSNFSIIPPAQGGTGVNTGLTELNASNLTSGIVPDARLSGNIARTSIPNNVLWVAVNKAGSSLADLEVRSASDLNTGTLAVARLPPDVVIGPLTPATLPHHHVNHERNGIDALKLDDLALPDDNADLDATISRHGLLPRLSGNALHRLNGVGLWSQEGTLPPYPNDPLLFLNGVGAWAYPPGSAPGAGTGDVTGPVGAVHGHITLFSGTSGKVIADGGTTITALHDLTVADAVADAVLAARADIIPVDLTSEVAGVLPASHLPATVLYAPLGPSDLPANLQYKPIGHSDLPVDIQYKPILLSDLPPLTVAALPAHHATHDTGGSDAMTALSGAVITTGTVADARLSANIPLLNAPTNTFTGVVVATGGLGATPLNASNLTTGTLPLARLTVHHGTHEPGGIDPMTVDAAPATGSLRTLGVGANQAAPGDDVRFTAPRVPTAHHATHEVGGSDVLANVAWTNQANTFTQNQAIAKAEAALVLGSGLPKTRVQDPVSGYSAFTQNLLFASGGWNADDVSLPAADFQINTDGSFAWYQSPAGPNPRTMNPLALLDLNGLRVNNGAFYEGNRTVPMGYWTTLDMAAYTTPALTGSLFYALIGKTLFIAAMGSRNLTTAQDHFVLTLPAGLRAATSIIFNVMAYSADTLNAGWQNAFGNLVAGGPSVDLWRSGQVNWPIGPAYVTFSVSFPVL